MTKIKNHTLLELLSELPDPRIDRQKRHHLVDIMTISILATICGADHWTEVEDFGVAREEWPAIPGPSQAIY